MTVLPNLDREQVGCQRGCRLVLCLISSSHYPTAVRVVVGNVHFRALLEALTAADAPRSNAMCPLYADVTQVILARTRTGVVRVRIPIDGCGHYQHVDVLMAARPS